MTSNIKTKEAFDTLWLTAIKGDLDLSRRLVRKGHNVNDRTLFERSTPLMNVNFYIGSEKFISFNGKIFVR